MQFLDCVLFLVISGLAIFLIGRIFPRQWIKADKFPFKSYKWEQNGKFYEKLKVKKWKTKLPDASVIIGKIFPKFMPKKRINGADKRNIKVLVKETCVAEFTHLTSALLGLFCIKLWKGWGALVSAVWIALNLPFVIIQRYNRPRLIKAC